MEEDGIVREPTAPACEGYKFEGWYSDRELTTKYEFSTPVKKSFILYAKWTKEKRTVTFDGNGHTPVPAPIEVEYGEPVAKPTAPTAEGYTFLGWYTEISCDNPYDFSLPVKNNLTLYARWVDASAKIWTVSFNLNGAEGAAPAPQTVLDGERADAPEDPVSEGRSFLGWYTAKSCRE